MFNRWKKGFLLSTGLVTLSPLPSPHRPSKTIMSLLDENKTEPGIGSLIYCQLLTAEHSGIYLGNGRVAQLNGRGEVEEVSLRTFTSNMTTLEKDIFIPLTLEGEPIHLFDVAARAKLRIGQQRNYHVLLDNCHQFSAACVSGDDDNANNFLWMAKDEWKEAADQPLTWLRWSWWASH